MTQRALGGGGGRTPAADQGGSRGRGESPNPLRHRPATVLRACKRVKTRAAIPYRELTGMGTCVRDGSRLGAHAASVEPSAVGTSRRRSRPRRSSSSSPWRRRSNLPSFLADREPEKYERAAACWHRRFAQEIPHLDLRESLAVIALLAAIPVNRMAASALAELLSRRRCCERIREALVRWSRVRETQQ
jgi:hypothetical protein